MRKTSDNQFNGNPFQIALGDYITKHDVAHKYVSYLCHLKPSHISRFLAGRNMPSLIIFARICGVLELDQAKLLSDLDKWFQENGSGYDRKNSEINKKETV